MTSDKLIAALLGLGLIAAITPAMAADNGAIREIFAELNRDGDKAITREEFEFKKVEVIFRRSAERGAVLRYEDTCISREAFDAIDRDKSGKITASDIRESPLFRFDSYDPNRDNRIDFREFEGLLSKLGFRPGCEIKTSR
jgi:Ca2+-binding EF-hand superfamily protein